MIDSIPWLTAIILLPLAAAFAIPFIPDKEGKTIRWYALSISLVTFGLSVWGFWQNFDPKLATSTYDVKAVDVAMKSRAALPVVAESRSTQQQGHLPSVWTPATIAPQLPNSK